jgi:hypothetical protein
MNGAGRGVFSVAALALLAFVACVTSEVTPLSSTRPPSRPPDCPVRSFPTTRPNYPYTDIASVRVECRRGYGRQSCVGELTDRACEMGADTIHDVREGEMGHRMFIAATVARQTAERPPPPPDSECSPICSPGFACQGGRCIPQCNPTCEPGEVCTRKRVCEPDL